MEFWKEITDREPERLQRINDYEYVWRTKITHIPQNDQNDIERWESLITVISKEQKDELELGLERPENIVNLKNQEVLKARVDELESKTLSLQEATATMYEEQSAYKLQMQEAIATLYEKIVELQGGQ